MDVSRGSATQVRAALGCLLLLASCAPAATPTLFRPPTSQPRLTEPENATPPPPASTATPTPEPTVSVSPTPCLDSLSFVEDVTVPDGTAVLPGASVDKQWLVTNDGTCTWNDSYHLTFVGGDPLGTAAEQSLTPAVPGAQVVLRIVFTAPAQPGRYLSKWQATGPDGTSFGSEVYVDLIVGG